MRLGQSQEDFPVYLLKSLTVVALGKLKLNTEATEQKAITN